MMNGATFAPGLVGQAFQLDGVSAYIRVPNDPSLNLASALTIEAWINPTSTTGPRVIASKWNDNTSDWSYIFKKDNTTDKLRVQLTKSVHGDLADLVGTTDLSLGAWIHAATTYDSSTGKVLLYFNGVQDGEQDVTPGQFIDSSVTDFLIGAVFTGGGINENFAGLIDELAIFNRALSPAEIQGIFNAGAAGMTKPTAGLSGHVFNDLNGNQTADPGEPGLAGQTVFLDTIDNGTAGAERSTTTDAAGNYTFSQLFAGTYRVREAQPAGWIQTSADPPAIVLGDGEIRPGINFGDYQLTNISGTVYNDLDGNNVSDPGDPGLAGWTVYLDNDASGNLSPGDSVATTDASGSFTFAGLPPGTYRVREVVPSGWLQTQTAPATLVPTSGVDNTGILLGNFQEPVLGGTLFNDLNGNGALDGGEPGLGGWTVVLDLNGTPLQTATTTSGGNYSFTGLGPGTYTVRENLQAGWLQTTSDPAVVVTSSGTSQTGLLGGNFQQVTAGGQVFVDRNGDGVQQSGEGAAAGWVLDLFRNDGAAPVATATSAADGSYSFPDLGPGSYRVRPEVPSGWLQTSADPTFFASSGTNPLNLNVGTFQQVLVRGLVFSDPDGDGVQQPGEGGLAGWGINLFRNGGTTPLTSATSDAGGTFSFTGVGPGTYRVREVAQASWLQTSANPLDFLASSGTDVTTGLAFGNKQGSFHGRVFEDLNGNGVPDAGEGGLAGWVVRMDRNGAGTFAFTATTDTSGGYSFTGLAPGTYRLREAGPAGWLQTTANPADVVEHAGQDVTAGLDFGNFQRIALGGQVFDDQNANAAQDAGEPGLAGWRIDLLRAADGSVATSTTTNAAGHYTFAGVAPGTYQLRAVGQVGWLQTTADPADVPARSGQDVTTGLDFGTVQTNTVSGQAFDDLDGNGIRDSGEPGLAGWQVTLLGLTDTNVAASATTDSGGNYLFPGLLPGTYRVRLLSPAGWVQTTADPPDVPVSGGATVLVAPSFGSFQRVTLSGQVFDDRNGNQLLDAGDGGLGGWQVNLFRAADTGLMATATTDGNGTYRFSGVGPGTYRVRAAQAAGFVQTTADPADLAARSGDNQTSLDFGVFQSITVSGTVFHDHNGNGTADAGDSGMGGWVVNLFANGSSSPSATATTTADGSYRFVGLGPGTYQVREPVPANWLQTTPDPAALAARSGGNVAGLDFGNFETAGLYGQVFEDVNGNGVRDLGEPGLADWTVFLDSNGSGMLDAGEPRTTTDANGVYTFGGLGPGVYRVRALLPQGFAPPAVTVQTVTTRSGVTTTGLDFANQRLASVRGRVFRDVNGDRSDDGGIDPGLAGMAVGLYRDATGSRQFDAARDPLLAAAPTGPDGKYQFGDLVPGAYLVREIAPRGRLQTFPAAPGVYAAALQSGATVTGWDFGNLGSANETFVAQAYLDLLGRWVDPVGLASWSGLLDAGGTRTDVARGIQGSLEYQIKLINEQYFTFLGRAADPVGLQAGLQLLNSPPVSGEAGSGLEQLRLMLLGSPEYQVARGHPNYGDFLAALYRDVLGREVDGFGSNAFLWALAQGMPAAAIAGQVLASPEAARAQVQTAYERYLHRPADAFGLDVFSNALLRGDPEGALVTALVGSDEYFAQL
jgi:protocatechuate 3,4-dioxygenase beta subunit